MLKNYLKKILFVAMVETQVLTAEEVEQHNTDKSAWIIMNDKVYDVSKFLSEHPGGEKVILDLAGQDATEAFDDVGHSSDARQMADDYLIGHLPSKEKKVNNIQAADNSWKSTLFSPTWSNLIIPVVVSAGIYVSFKIAQRLFDHI